MLRTLAVITALSLFSYAPLFAQCIYCDGDGFPFELDCDDTNAAVHPGAAEICDELDNDCNGYIDEGLSEACSTGCGIGVSICASGRMLICSAPPCCDATIDPSVDLCSAAGTSGTTVCLLPGVYPLTSGCTVKSNLRSMGAPGAAIIDGDLALGTAVRLEGLTVQGGVSTGLLSGVLLFDDVVTGPVSIGSIDVYSWIQRNQFRQGLTLTGGGTIRDNRIDGGVSLSGTNPREIIGNTVQGTGIAFNTAARTLVQANRIDSSDVGIRRFATAHDSYKAWIVGNTISAQSTGMLLPFGPNLSANLQVLLNKVRNFSGDGIVISYFAGDDPPPRIAGNIIDGAPASGAGIAVSYGYFDPSGSLGPQIVGNTVLNVGTGIRIDCSSCTDPDATIASNIIAFNSQVGVDVVGPAPLAASNNDFFGNASDGLPLGPTDLSADPLFVDPSGGDFHVRPESLCLDHGRQWTYVIDQAGSSRSQDGDLDGAAVPEVGALESSPEAGGLTVEADPLRVRWDPYPFASAGYDLYRGRWSLLHSNGIVQGPPLCGWTGTTFDAEEPIPEGDGAIYLVVPHGAVAGSLGFDSTGKERPNPAPCP